MLPEGWDLPELWEADRGHARRGGGARARIITEIDRLAERRARISEQLDAVDPA